MAGESISKGEGAPQCVALEEHPADVRGRSFSVPALCLEYLGEPRDMHVAGIEPGHVRGNHFHVQRRELIVVLPHDAWSLHWDAGADTEPARRRFVDAGAVAIAIPPGAAHAIRNDGAATLWLIAATDGPYDPANPDAHRRVLTSG
jgi:dTDP-4-dehydrorhamnose 3,5-epimerase-like enzyme